jgi:hypothetical protein
MRTRARLTFGVLAILAAASTASADVRLTIQGGRVTLVAKDATVRQILAEWERVGHTKVINGERIAGGPVTLELTNVPEQQALDVLLRSASGVVLAPRAGAIDNMSAFERIIVMPTSTAPQPSNSLPAAPAAGPAPFQPQAPTADDDLEDRPAPGGPPQNRPVFMFPQPQTTTPPQMPNLPPGGAFGGPPQQPGAAFPQPPGAFPQPPAFPPQGVPGAVPPAAPYPGAATAPVGVSVPGMVVPVPAPPPGQPGSPPPPRPQNP